MKKWFVVLVMAILFFACAQINSRAEALPTTTVIVYMCGSNLESQYGQATNDIFEMMESGYNSKYTNVVVMTGGSKRWDIGAFDPDRTGVYRLRGSGNPKEIYSCDALNMGQSDTLRLLLDIVYEEFQTDRYMLIFWDHGGGPVKGVCWDENFKNDSLTMTELISGIDASVFADRKLDAIGFDACLMGSVETAWMLSDRADYLIASEEREPASGWDYSFLNGIEMDASLADTGRRIVDKYIDSFPEDHAGVLTLSLINLSEIQGVVEEMDAFFEGISAEMTEKIFQEMSALRHYAQGFGRDYRAEESTDYDLVDIVSLLNSYGKYESMSSENLRAALDKAILYNRSNHEDSHGLSIYFPYFNQLAYEKTGSRFLDELDFCKGYTNYIKKFQKYLTGEQAVDWRGLYPTVTREGDGFKVQLDLTKEQAEDMVSAKLVVFDSTFAPGSSNAYYEKIYGSANVKKEPDGSISAKYSDECLVFEFETENGLMSRSNAIPFLILDSGEYQVSALAANVKSAYANQAAHDEPGVSHMMHFTLSAPDEKGDMRLKSIQTYDSVTDTFTTRSDDSPDNYKYLHFINYLRVMTEENGLLLAYDRWNKNYKDALPVYANYSAVSDSEWSFIINQETHKELRFAAFEITDSQNNTFTTGLTLVRPLEETVLYQKKFELPAPRIDISVKFIATSPYDVLLMFEVTNREEEDMYSFNIESIQLNGKKIEIASNVSVMSRWKVEPGKTVCASEGLSIVDTFEAGRDQGFIKDIEFSMSLYAGENDAYLGTLEGLSIQPDISFSKLNEAFR
ncbi:MAG: hypothetical protein IKJ65_02935 [Clostridia bacterium]|nr:hypothetical protein [Clostridia bacterium]